MTDYTAYNSTLIPNLLQKNKAARNFSMLPYCRLAYFLFYSCHNIIYCLIKDNDIQPVSDLYPETVCGLNLLLQWCCDGVHLCFKKLLYLIGICCYGAAMAAISSSV